MILHQIGQWYVLSHDVCVRWWWYQLWKGLRTVVSFLVAFMVGCIRCVASFPTLHTLFGTVVTLLMTVTGCVLRSFNLHFNASCVMGTHLTSLCCLERLRCVMAVFTFFSSVSAASNCSCSDTKCLPWDCYSYKFLQDCSVWTPIEN